jgi:hypothetical protein
MSEPLRVAFVVEGPTDRVVLEAAISQILDGRPYIPIQLQPEQSAAFGQLGTGWGGVFRWCQQAAARGGGSLSGDPVFQFQDVLIVHLDADVADGTYSDANIQNGFGDLPCSQPCPPARATTDRLRRVLLGWCGSVDTPHRTVLCVPSKSTEAWVLAALFPNNREVRSGYLECVQDPGLRLRQQPIGRRIRKAVAEYREYSEALSEAWTRVTGICAEAQRFDAEFRVAANLELPQESAG